MRSGKYGTKYTNLCDIPGGDKFTAETATTPPSTIEACSLDVIQSGSTGMYEQFGLTDVKSVPYESTEGVSQDPEFWKMFLEEPNIVCRTAVQSEDA